MPAVVPTSMKYANEIPCHPTVYLLPLLRIPRGPGSLVGHSTGRSFRNPQPPATTDSGVIFREAFNCLIKTLFSISGRAHHPFPFFPFLPWILLKRTKFVTFSADLAGGWVGRKVGGSQSENKLRPADDRGCILVQAWPGTKKRQKY